MPKRLNTLKRKKRQTTHTPHPHNKKAPRSFANTTIAHSKFLMCIDAKFPPTQQNTPKFRNMQKSKVSDYLKRPSKFPPTQQSTPKFHNEPKSKVSGYLKRPSKFPPTQQSTTKFHNTPKSKVSGNLKRPSKFPYTHEVREFLTIPHPNTSDQTPTPHLRSILGFLIASKIPTFQGKISHLGVSTDHHPRHRERAVIRLCACRKMPNTLADVNLP